MVLFNHLDRITDSYIMLNMHARFLTAEFPTARSATPVAAVAFLLHLAATPLIRPDR